MFLVPSQWTNEMFKQLRLPLHDTFLGRSLRTFTSSVTGMRLDTTILANGRPRVALAVAFGIITCGK